MLLHMAASAAGAPTARARLARWLRAALLLIEDEEPAPPIALGANPASAKALEELAFSLSLATEHATFLAEEAAITQRAHRLS